MMSFYPLCNLTRGYWLKELLAVSVGVGPSPLTDHRTDFAEFCGIWTTRDAHEFKLAASDLELVDEADWQ